MLALTSDGSPRNTHPNTSKNGHPLQSMNDTIVHFRTFLSPITESQLPKRQLNRLQLAKNNPSEKGIVTERYGNARPFKKEGLSAFPNKKTEGFDLDNEYGMNTRHVQSELSFHMHGISSAMIGIVNVMSGNV